MEPILRMKEISPDIYKFLQNVFIDYMKKSVVSQIVAGNYIPINT